jgi:hypothetical protein
MRDRTPGGTRQTANRDEVRAREADRSARRIGDAAFAAARGVIAYAEYSAGNITLATNTERVIVPAITIPVDAGRQYRAASRSMVWTDGSSASRALVYVRFLLSADGASATTSSPLLDFSRPHTPAAGYATDAHTNRLVPPIDTDQYAYLSIVLTAVSPASTGGVEANSDAGAARLFLFDEGAVVGAANLDTAALT